MKKLYYILFTFHFAIGGSLLTIYSQPLTQERMSGYSSPITQYTQFQLSIGTPNTDVAHSIIQTTDGGYAVAGYTWQGGFYAYIAKLDASGTLQWTRTLGGTGDDIISSIIQTNDGGYIAAGSSIFKLDSNGMLGWCENISGWGNSIIQTSDGSYVVAGYTNSYGAGGYDMFIIKLNSSGTLQWARTIGGTGWDSAYSIIQTADGGYAVAGISSLGIGLFTVIKLNNSGNLQWARTLDGDDANSIVQTTDGGYAVVGRSPPIPYKFYVIKLDSTGTLQWGRTVGLRDADNAKSIIQTFDGGYAVVGSTSYIEGNLDWYIVKLYSTGTLEWSRVITGATGSLGEAFTIIKTLDSGYAIAGFKDSFEPAGDMYIVKYDSNWNTCSSNDSLVSSSPGTLGTITTVTPIVTSPTSFITPRTPTVGSGGTATMICVTGIQPVSNEVPVSFKLYQNYPNPFNSMTKIKYQISKREDVNLKIFDVLGHEITTLVDETLSPGIYEAEWDGENYPSGVYFYRLEASDALPSLSTRFAETRKLVLIK
jgi:Secretion system C-terminal sorting domain/Domain of unknown function (DUF5122) beta-propeller